MTILNFVVSSPDLTILFFWVPVILGIIVFLVKCNLFKGM